MIDIEFLRALKDGAPRAVFVDIDHPDGPAHLWTGLGDVEWRGFTYKGAGQLASIQVAQKTVELRVDEVTMTVAGLNPEILSGVSDEMRDREIDVWLACLTPESRVRGAVLLDNMRADFMTDAIGGDGLCTVTLTAESGMWPLTRTTEEVWSPQNQKLRYASDAGFDLIPSMRNKITNWKRT